MKRIWGRFGSQIFLTLEAYEKKSAHVFALATGCPQRIALEFSRYVCPTLPFSCMQKLLDHENEEQRVFTFKHDI
jgi:hypothetical protein